MRKILLPVLFFSPLCGWAQTAAGDNSLDAYLDSVSRQFDLGEVVITGTRTPKFLKDTGSPAKVCGYA